MRGRQIIIHKLAKYVFCQIVITAIEENKEKEKKKKVRGIRMGKGV